MKRFFLCGILLSLLCEASSFVVLHSPLQRVASPAIALRRTNLVQLRNAVRTRTCMTATTKESPLEGGGARGLEEEERRVGLWKTKYELTDSQVEALRKEFESAMSASSGDLRTISKDQLRRVIETASAAVDVVDVHQGDFAEEGRPEVSQEELSNYVAALTGQWEETCDVDAVEVANGECQDAVDLENFDLPETLAVFGMCLTNHCGIGGVCFWDSE